MSRQGFAENPDRDAGSLILTQSSLRLQRIAEKIKNKAFIFLRVRCDSALIVFFNRNE